jgi:PadR family transcriptional regulator PadR
MIAGNLRRLLLFVCQPRQEANDFRPELRYAPFQQTPDRRVVNSAVRVSQLVSEGDDRARIRDVGGQLRLVLQGNAERLTYYLELTLAISQRIQQISRDALQVLQGSLYPALHRLETRGLLAAGWQESESGREAKFYGLTPKGRAQLKTETANWTRLTEAIAIVLRAAEGEAQ